MLPNIYKNHHDILVALNQFANIRYAAYRTAAKLRFIQTKVKLDCVKLTHVITVAERFNLSSSEKELLLSRDELKPVILEVFLVAQREILVQLDPKIASRLVLGILLETYDKNGKKGGCTLLNFFTFFTVLCGETVLGEKYRKVLQFISDHNSCIQRRNLALLLKSISSLAHLVNEAPAFGHWTVLQSVQQCFEQEESHLGMPEESIFASFVRDPQAGGLVSLVWWSTLYRLNVSSKVIHSARCSVCNTNPLQGLRYQCLKCISYNQCQQCFWTGLVSKGHKITHQMQEYCTKTTNREAGQALWKKISNWMSLKKTRPQPTWYLPLEKKNDLMKSSESFAQVVRDDMLSDTTVLSVGGEGNQPELVSLLAYLMEEKGKLEGYVKQAGSSNTLGMIVKEHCEQLELQLLRLRQLVLEKNEEMNIETVMPKLPKLLTRLESTPLVPNHQRKAQQEHLVFSPIIEPRSIQRSVRERQSLRSVKASIVTNGTLNYCTPRYGKDTALELPRFSTEFSLVDLSRNLQQSAGPSFDNKSSVCDSQLNAELEEILAQLEKLFPTEEANTQLQHNKSLIKVSNQVAGTLADFVVGFKE